MSGSADYTLTPNLGLYRPNYDMDDGLWGTHLNANADVLDSAIAALQAGGGSGGGGGGPYLLLTGGVLTGALTLAGVPTVSLHPATKSYVDALVAVDNPSFNLGVGTPYNPFGTDAGNYGNTAAGYNAMAVHIGGGGIGHNNTAFGQSAMAASVSVLASVAVGSNAIAEETTGQFLTGVGSNAGWVWQGAYGSIAMGHGAQGGDDFTPAPNVSGSNVTLGSWSGQELTSGGGNAFVGTSTGIFLTTGQHNAVLGSFALAGGPGATATAIPQVAASYNVAVGDGALRNTTGNFLVGVGASALAANVGGLFHCAVGRSALSLSVADVRNTAIGANAGQTVNGANNMTAVGALSQQLVTTGADNTTVGSQTGAVMTTGAQNTVIGMSAGFKLTTGSANVLIGNRVASTTLTTGSNNILIGVNANCDTVAAGTINTFRVFGSSTTPIIDAINTQGTNPQVQFPGCVQVGPGAALAMVAGEMGHTVLTTLAGSNAPGASGAKLLFGCGTNAGTAKLMAKAGTSNTFVTLIDNIGAGVAGC